MAAIDKEAEAAGLNLSVMIDELRLSNPIMTASGTFSAPHSGKFYDIEEMGAVVTKGVTAEPWQGNDTPRVAEVFGGMLNSVGLQNPGVDRYIAEELPLLRKYDTKVIANIAGHTVEDYVRVVDKLNYCSEVSMYEVNISCPNIKDGGMAFGTSPASAARVTEAVKRIAQKPVMVKLTPNVTDIAAIALAVEDAGADALSLINTLIGMHIDLKSKRATLAEKTGGMSGPAIKPIALRMVYEVARRVEIPVIGMGGINRGTDVVEFLAAGASAVAVGTAAFMDPAAPVRIKRELVEYMKENDFATISEIKHAFDI